ncbi:hypothetical protein HAZT_HAZT004301 [Hyalella azteca]|uniref:Uncharacterized protein n=1 Tax=Hyalella azteca TaxID=294128 RepID=A0A6A0H1Z4_HYAAZ|nr:hypothetical protein HAZT_HAZT004301 [Hyalella azteca]
MTMFRNITVPVNGQIRSEPQMSAHDIKGEKSRYIYVNLAIIQEIRGYLSFSGNQTSPTDQMEDEILSVRYEDGIWSEPYFDCGGGNIWMLTYTVPFFGYHAGKYHFK